MQQTTCKLLIAGVGPQFGYAAGFQKCPRGKEKRGQFTLHFDYLENETHFMKCNVSDLKENFKLLLPKKHSKLSESELLHVFYPGVQLGIS